MNALQRRTLSISLYFLAAGAWLATLPALLICAVAADVLRRAPWTFVRLTLFAGYYLGCELVGIVASGVLWAFSSWSTPEGRQRYLDRNFRLQSWWGTTLGAGSFAIFGLKLQIDRPFVPPSRPILLLMRHASVADTVLAVMLVSAPHHIVLRYVLKKELLWDPCLDIVGNRLPNHFVDRSGGHSAAEAQSVGRLAQNLVQGEGVMIYPEGTRFTAKSRARALSRLQKAGHEDALQRARRFRAVLPPRLGGTLALLENAPEADVVFCAHTGLEGSTSFANLANGGLIDKTVRVTFWTVPSAEIPEDRAAKELWLDEHWRRIDDFVVAGGAL